MTLFEQDNLLNQLSAFAILASSEDRIRALYGASAKLELPLIDYITIRDLLELSGCPRDVHLVAVIIALFAALEEGSLCLDLKQDGLSRRLMAFLGPQQAEEMAEAFLSHLSTGRYDGLITKNGHEYMPLILSEKEHRRLLYFQKFYLHETLLRRRMDALLQAEASICRSDEDMDSLIDEIYDPAQCIRLHRDGDPVERDDAQIAAIRLSLRSQFTIISGGPGTGKTSLIINMLRCLVRSGIKAENILLGAPTGRAAQRMTEAIQFSISTIQSPAACDTALLNLKGSTLHKLLRYRSSHRDFYYCQANPLPASVIILDEVSMVDVIMMARFLQSVDPMKTKLVLLGDKDQLPSVEAGAVFAEMIPEGGTRAERFKDRLILLKTVYRSGKNLLELAGQVNQGCFPECRPMSFEAALQQGRDQWAVVPNGGRRAWNRHIRQWVDHYYLGPVEGDGRIYKDLVYEADRMDSGHLVHSETGLDILNRIFKKVKQARILSLVRNGTYGCNRINQEIAARLGPEMGHPAWFESEWFPGAVVMVTRNDYAKALYNGDVGVVLRDRVGAYRAFFPRFGSYIAFAMDVLPPWELAFSTTVHKSQGSEFDDVLLVLPEDETHRLLTREIVYTGITRARERVIIHGSEPGLENALKRKIDRQSGFEW